tara:strand:- start:1171 stop:1365 length:195 start_codon:yes stop_codon:yes gene_type:complete
MNFLKTLFKKSSNKEIVHLKERLKQAEELLTCISEDQHAKISVNTSLDIWEFLHSEEINKNKIS